MHSYTGMAVADPNVKDGSIRCRSFGKGDETWLTREERKWKKEPMELNRAGTTDSCLFTSKRPKANQGQFCSRSQLPKDRMKARSASKCRSGSRPGISALGQQRRRTDRIAKDLSNPNDEAANCSLAKLSPLSWRRNISHTEETPLAVVFIQRYTKQPTGDVGTINSVLVIKDEA